MRRCRSSHGWPAQATSNVPTGSVSVEVSASIGRNRGPSALSVVVPFTTRDRGLNLHVRVDPPEGGLSEHSVLLPEQIQAADQQRLVKLLGTVTEDTLRTIEDRLRIVLGLDNPIV